MGDAGVNVVLGKVMDLVFGAVKKELSYMCNCSENVKTFKDDLEKLQAMRKMFQDRINEAKDNAQKPREDLVNWMKNADDKISNAETFIVEQARSKKTCCNLHHYGKKAIKGSSSLQKHHQDGERLKDCVFDSLPHPRDTDLYKRKNLENSQKLALKNVVCALEDENKQIVGITGLGGVGKTTLASEAAAELKNKFDYIEFIAVSNSVNIEGIKKNVDVASKKILNEEKVLIVLDDVWEELKLDEVGIPCGSRYMNCKILLTSRNKDVCNKMNAHEIITLEPLPKKEAWTLFEQVVGISEWDSKLKQVAWKIVKECGGLPLFVQAVGTALKDKDIQIWDAELHQLQAPLDGDAPCNEKELRILMLSYKYLKSEIAKSCLLLCSVFPEDCSIGLNKLTYYGLALGILNNPRSIQDAKVKVRRAVDSLKSSFLLQPVERFNFQRVSFEETFKMHDIVRDMALFVASEVDDKILVESSKSLREWQPRNEFIKTCKKISLMGTKITKLPDYKLDLSHLNAFLIQDNYELSSIPDEFFRGMENLKVLDMSYNKIPALPQSLKYLTNLHTLYLSGNSSLCEISILGELTSLEILMLRRTGITNIPKEIGKLTNLRVLDVDYCSNLFCVTPGVLLKLHWLEEFYIRMKKGKCKFLKELSELKLLKVLHLKVPNLHDIPEDFHFENLMEFHIEDNVVLLQQTHGCKRILKISPKSYPLATPIMKLIQVSENLELWKINDLDNILQVVYPAGFEKLRYIHLLSCENVRSLVKTSALDKLGQRNGNVKFFSQVEEIILRDLDRLELLWDGPHPNISFSNLTTIYIKDCGSLLKLFPLSVAQGLDQLRKLYILGCESLAVVISAGDEQSSGISETISVDTDVMFSKLNTICLSALPKLESFYHGYSIITYPSLDNMSLEDCPSMKRWGNGENHMPKIKFEHEGRPYSNINDYIAAQLEMNGESRMRDWCIPEYPSLDYPSPDYPWPDYAIEHARNIREKIEVKIRTLRAAIQFGLM